MNSLTHKMESNLTAVWVNFFSAAGIPSEVAASYALTFAENRIQNDMLLDLNKEYLRDMGISRMGDVIAILRHAKQVHETTARERVLSSAVVSNSAKVPVAAVAARSTSVQASSPASRILEHYIRNPTNEISSVAQKRKSLESSSNVDTDVIVKKSRHIRIGSPTHSVVTKVVPSKQTVFARLGGTDPVVAATKTTKATTTAPKQDIKPIFARLGSKTVDQPDQIIPIEKDALKYEGILKAPANSAVKKMTVTTSQNSVRRFACTMRADEAPLSVKEKIAVPKKSVSEKVDLPKVASKSVKFSNTVQYKVIEANKKGIVQPAFSPIFNKPERRLSMPEPKLYTPKSRLSLPEPNNGIKARLGNKGPRTVNSTMIHSNVFNRLGI